MQTINPEKKRSPTHPLVRCALALALVAGLLPPLLQPESAYPQAVQGTDFFSTGTYLTFNNAPSGETGLTEADFLDVHGGSIQRTFPSYDKTNAAIKAEGVRLNGGSVSADGTLRTDTGDAISIYNTNLIMPKLLGNWPAMAEEAGITLDRATYDGAELIEGVPGWVFTTDATYASSQGAGFSVMYRNVGTVRDAGDRSVNVPFDMKVTFNVKKAGTRNIFANHDKDYYGSYNGRNVVQFTDWPSAGFWQVGIKELETTFEFFEAGTKTPIPLDSLYFCDSSCDDGEGFSTLMPTRAIYHSSDAHMLDGSDRTVTPATQYARNHSVLPGSYMVDLSKDLSPTQRLTKFIGVPLVKDTAGKTWDYGFSSTLGNPSFYWRSACALLDMRTSSGERSNSLTMIQHAGDSIAAASDSGSCWWVPSFRPISNVLPELSKTVDKAEAQAGEILTYRVEQRVNSLTGSDADGFLKYRSLVFEDVVPAEVTLDESSVQMLDPSGNPLPSSAGTCSYNESSRTIRFAFNEEFLSSKDGLIYEGGIYTLTYRARVDETLATAQIANNARVTINDTPQTAHALTVVNSATIKLDKQASQFEVLAGDTVHYRIAVENTSEGVAKNVVVADTLPSSLLLLPNSLTVTGASSTVTYPVVSDDGASFETQERDAAPKSSVEENSLRVTLPYLGAEQRATIEYDAKVLDSHIGQIDANHATASCDNPQPDSLNPVEDESSTWANNAKLSLTKTADAFEYGQGDTVTYTLGLSNLAAGTIARDVVVSDENLPEGLVIDPNSIEVQGVPAQVEVPLAQGETATIPNKASATMLERGFRIAIPLLPANTLVSITFTATTTEAANGKELLNSATARCSNPQEGFEQVTSQDGIWVNQAHLAVQKSASSSEVAVGDVVTYRVELTNLAAGTVAKDVSVLDRSLPSGMLLIDDSFKATGMGESVSYPVDGQGQRATETRSNSQTGGIAGNAIEYRVAYLPAGETITIEYQARAAETVNGQIVTNTANASCANPAPDCQEASDSVDVLVNSPLASIEKQADKAEHRVGDSVTYTLTIRNESAGSIARNVRISDELPEEALDLDIESLSVESLPNEVSYPNPSEGPNACETRLNDAAITPTANGFCIELAYLPYDKPVTITYCATALDGGNGTCVSNTATLDCPLALDGGKRSATATIWINTPHLQVEKSVAKERYHLGETVAYEVVVTSRVPGTLARGVALSDLIVTEGMDLHPTSIKAIDDKGSVLEIEPVTQNNAFDLVFNTPLAAKEGLDAVQQNGIAIPEAANAATSFTITYEADVVSHNLRGHIVENTAEVACENGEGAQTQATTNVINPKDTGGGIYAATGNLFKKMLPILIGLALLAGGAFGISRYLRDKDAPFAHND